MARLAEIASGPKGLTTPPPSILRVDDEPHSLSALWMALEDGFECLRAGEADATLRQMDEEWVQVVICDQRMPGRAGAELLTEVRILRETLTRHRWNKGRAAAEVGLSRVGLRAKLDRYGIAAPGYFCKYERGNLALRDKQVTMAHGGGGKAMRDLIEEVFTLVCQPAGSKDQARLMSAVLQEPGARLALTTDSFVVTPLAFPGGDIGKITVCGMVNDLAVGGARPLWQSAAFIIEEGSEVALLRRIVASIAAEAGLAVELDEARLPLRPEVAGVCEILGLDPLYLANKGRLVLFCPPDQAEAALAAMHALPEGAGAVAIGVALSGQLGRVTMRTRFGGARIVDMLVGEQLPRIC